MLGLGETKEEVLNHSRGEKCQCRYYYDWAISSTDQNHLPVKRFVELEEFEEYRILQNS